MKLLEIIKLTVRILNPFSETSIWSDAGFNECGKITTGIIGAIVLITLAFVTGNFIPPYLIPFYRSDYNYTTGCDGNQLPIGDDNQCYNYNGTIYISRDRIRCNNINNIKDYIFCGCLGTAIVFAVIVIGIVIYFIGIKINELCLYTRDVFMTSYNRSIKTEIEMGETEVN